MKALELSEAFRAAFDADSAFAGVPCLNDIGTAEITLPCLIFKVDDKPLNGNGTALTYALAVWIESSADVATPREAHAALMSLVRTKLHGTGKAALLAALNTAAAFDWRGWSAADDAPGIEAHHFRTSICATGTVLVL